MSIWNIIAYTITGLVMCYMIYGLVLSFKVMYDDFKDIQRIGGRTMKPNKKQVKELKKLRLSVRTFSNLMYERLAEKYLVENFTGWNDLKNKQIIRETFIVKCQKINIINYFDDHIDLANMTMFDYFHKKR